MCSSPKWNNSIIYHQFTPVQISCSVLSNSCDPVDCSTPGFPVRHQLPEFTQTHIHKVSDAIQPSYPLLLPLLLPPPVSRSFPVSQFFSSGDQSIGASTLAPISPWIFRTDFLEDCLVGSPCCPRDSQESFPTPQFKSINSSVLSFLHSPTLTSIHDHWENHSLD